MAKPYPSYVGEAQLQTDSDAWFDAAHNALAQNDAAEALRHFKAAYEASQRHPALTSGRQDVVEKAFVAAAFMQPHTHDPLLIAQYHSFIAPRTIQEAVKEAAMNAAIHAVEMAATPCKDTLTDHAAVARAAFKIMDICEYDTQGIVWMTRARDIVNQQFAALEADDAMTGGDSANRVAMQLSLAIGEKQISPLSRSFLDGRRHWTQGRVAGQAPVKNAAKRGKYAGKPYLN